MTPGLIAGFAALTAFNQFLVTPAGQTFATHQEQLVATLMGHFKVHLAPVPSPIADALERGIVTGPPPAA